MFVFFFNWPLSPHFSWTRSSVRTNPWEHGLTSRSGGGTARGAERRYVMAGSGGRGGAQPGGGGGAERGRARPALLRASRAAGPALRGEGGAGRGGPGLAQPAGRKGKGERAGERAAPSPFGESAGCVRPREGPPLAVPRRWGCPGPPPSAIFRPAGAAGAGPGRGEAARARARR